MRAWWQLLTTDEQHRLVVRHAAALGAADGVPLAVRAAANELRLARDIARLSRERPPAGRPPWLLGTCLAVADALGHARAQRDPVTGRRLPASLLVYRPAAFGGQGRAAVAVGDVSRADNVAVLVPGLGSTVGATLRDLTVTAARVTALARATSPQEATATIAWTAYDAPNLLQVAGDAAAVTGAPLLTSDLRALRAASGDAMHLTAVGHSYGSTTVGTALRAHSAGVDDVVLLGSPGANVERAAALRVPAGHVWAGAASRDPVSYLDRFGADPSQEGFGATRFRAEDSARHPVMLSFGDHSRYFAPGSESLTNVVRVVVGDGDAVSVATYRRETPWLPDGIAADPEADRPPAGTAGRSW
ncbi:MAG TPA: alpha/beta hydrolase [Actinomycetes bacterium]|nr:alpha/beta hydrolase [Actinomycetes bacterium]